MIAIALGAMLAFGARSAAEPGQGVFERLGQAIDNPATTFFHALEAQSPLGRIAIILLAALAVWASIVVTVRRVRDTGAPTILALPVIFAGPIGYLTLCFLPPTKNHA
jgi:uncharacterized membrane protein YhaH (DUF805 family)